jgi:serine/threonine protein kinase
MCFSVSTKMMFLKKIQQAEARERRVQKQRGRSVWPEYAVKVISTEKIKEMGYEQNIVREIAVLRNLSHPGIARLVIHTKAPLVFLLFPCVLILI